MVGQSGKRLEHAHTDTQGCNPPVHLSCEGWHDGSDGSKLAQWYRYSLYAVKEAILPTVWRAFLLGLLMKKAMTLVN